MSRRSIAVAVALGTFLGAAAASAQTVVVVEPGYRHVEPGYRYECRRHWAQGQCRYPRLALALDLGLSSFNESGPFGFDTGVGKVTDAGPAWGGRVGVEFAPWFAIDAHYIGMYDAARGTFAPNGDLGLLTSAMTGELRFTAPLRYVQPYIFTGVGVYSTSVVGSDDARLHSPMIGSTELGVPIGLGVGFPVTRRMSVGVEFTYHRLFNESFDRKDDEIGGGDLFTGNAVLRYRL